MANKIIEEAFVEGRETETEWAESEAKKNQDNLNVSLHNGKMFDDKIPLRVIPMQRLDPTTLEVLDWYPTRLAAAQWICVNVLNRSDKNPVSICGNLEMCMRAGWKSYGFRWKMVTPEEYQAHLLVGKHQSHSKKIFVHRGYHSPGLVYPSVNAAERELGIAAKTIRDICNNMRPTYNGLSVRWYQENKVRVKVKSRKEAGRIWGVSLEKASAMIERGEYFNNIHITVV